MVETIAIKESNFIAESLQLWQVVASYFTAGILCNSSEVIEKAAPILAWSKGKTLAFLKEYCLRKKWTCTRIE
jgi:hypothetical protein